MKLFVSITASFLLFFSSFFSYAGDPIKILFLGSSSTYCHDMPQQVSEWLNANAGWNSTAYLTGKSGTGVHEYMRPGFSAQYGLDEGETLIDKIRNGKYDYVVIQQITYFIADKDSQEIIEDTEILCREIRKAGGQPVFYEMGWRLPAMNDTGRYMILQEAIKNNVELYAPCSRAWKRVRADRPDIELHNLPDTDHPGTLGNYLNLCCFYATLTGESPVGLPANVKYWPRFGAFDKDEAKKKLHTAELDYYHQGMPEWMKMIAIMGGEAALDPETALYLQETAWNVYNEIKPSLK